MEHQMYQHRLALKNTILVREMDVRDLPDRVIELSNLNTQTGTGMRTTVRPTSGRVTTQPIPGHPQLYAIPQRHQEILDILNTQ